MRNVWFSWFNFICLLFVIYEHLNAVDHGLVMYKIGMLVIPIFSIIAGYSWGVFLKRTNGEGGIYALKMFLYPYLFWVGVYFFMNNVLLDVFIRGEAFKWPTCVEWFRIILFGDVCSHLYFLGVLIIVSALTVWLKRLVRRAFPFNALIALIGLAALVFSQLKLPSSKDIDFLQDYFCWIVPNLCCGILLAIPKADIYKRAPVKLVALMLLLVGAVVHWHVEGHASSVVMACAIIALTMAHPKIYAPKWLTATAPYIMGIYLVHGLIDAGITEVQKALGMGQLSYAVGWPVSAVVFFVSLTVVWVQRKMPYLRNCV